MRVNIKNGRCFRCNSNATAYCYKQLETIIFIRPFCPYCLSKISENVYGIYDGWYFISDEEVLCLEVVES